MLLDDVATYLAAQSTALSIRSGTAGNLAKSISLENTALPNTCVVLYENSGTIGAYAWSTGGSTAVYEQPNLQVLSRSTKYATARTNAETVYTTLNQYTGTLPTATGTRYLSIDALGPPFGIGRDERERFLVSLNFTVRKEVG